MVNGCQSCLCNPGPSTCPKIRCSLLQACRFGVQKVNGCPTCSCKPRLCPLWSSYQCRRRCLSGYTIRTVGRRGCPTCMCRRRSRFGAANVPAVSLSQKRPVCGPVCAIFCKCGNIPDERGCPTCRCRPCGPSICPLRRCARPIECRFGVKKVNGCPTCECNPGPADCSKVGCPPDVAIKCAYGVKIINGCPSCSCNSGPVCPKRRCFRICKNGFKMVNGCQSCLCNPGPSTCPKIRCSLLQACRFGVQKVNGCPTCSCKPRLCPLGPATNAGGAA
ncbi:BPTI/Kunitz domain-containing protein 4-like, partial [Haliotis rubra]|uniref:BPTI/Kunitz domain-containing protein 4-like n=1 Tax=Haliotis rubra TaxID=36100 RepID=UPI001EE6146A